MWLENVQFTEHPNKCKCLDTGEMVTAYVCLFSLATLQLFHTPVSSVYCMHQLL